MTKHQPQQHPTDIEGDPATRVERSELIKQRMQMHPHADVREIVASLEIDSIFVTADEVQKVRDQVQGVHSAQ